MAEPLLHLGDVGFMRKRVCCRRRAHRVNTQAGYLDIQPCGLPVFSHHIPVNGIRIERPIQLSRAVVPHRAEQRAIQIIAMTGQQQITFNEPLRKRMHRHIPDLVALALHLEMLHALAALRVFDAQAAQLLPAHAVIEQGGDNRPVAYSFHGIFRRRFQQPPRLIVG